MASPHWLYIMHLAARRGWPALHLAGVTYPQDIDAGAENWRRWVTNSERTTFDQQLLIELLRAMDEVKAGDSVDNAALAFASALSNLSVAATEARTQIEAALASIFMPPADSAADLAKRSPQLRVRPLLLRPEEFQQPYRCEHVAAWEMEYVENTHFAGRDFYLCTVCEATFTAMELTFRYYFHLDGE